MWTRCRKWEQQTPFSYYTNRETSNTKRAPKYGGSYQTIVRWAHYSLSGATVQIVRVIGRLTGLPFGPSSPGGPLGPAGPAAPGGPDSPFSPLSPLGPCNGRMVVRKVIHRITTATAAFLFFPKSHFSKGSKDWDKVRDGWTGDSEQETVIVSKEISVAPADCTLTSKCHERQALFGWKYGLTTTFSNR